MIRTKSLENQLYRRKYREIYKLIFNADLDIVTDQSNWMYKHNDYIQKNHPLWIIIESKILNKRIWIIESYGKLELATAQLDLDCRSIEYSKSYEWNFFNSQKELCNSLKEILAPCFEKNQELDLEIER